jgi:hypothetical protein
MQCPRCGGEAEPSGAVAGIVFCAKCEGASVAADAPGEETPDPKEQPGAPFLLTRASDPLDLPQLAAAARRDVILFVGILLAAVGLQWALEHPDSLHWVRFTRLAGQIRPGQVRRSGSDLLAENFQPPRPLPPLYVSPGEDALAAVLRSPVGSLEDVARAHLTLAGELSGGGQASCSPDARFRLADSFAAPEACIIAEITDLNGSYRLRLVSFGKSDTRVFRVLREEFHLPPPAGDAVVRIFDDTNDLPPALGSFARGSPETAGACFGTRFIAVLRADEDLEDLVSHELVHAYVMSLLGSDADVFPNWFHEGLALNISRNPVTAIAGETPSAGLRISMLTAQYRQYKHVFDRIEKRLGRARYVAAVSECLRDRRLGPLYAATGAADYAGLVGFADTWSSADTRTYAEVIGAATGVGLAAVFWRRRARSRRLQIARYQRSAVSDQRQGALWVVVNNGEHLISAPPNTTVRVFSEEPKKGAEI